MRIVHLGKYYPPASGGIENHTQTLARSQVSLGAHVRVIVVNHADRHGVDVTFDRFKRTPNSTDADGSIEVIRAGRWANLAKLDIAPKLLSLLQVASRTQTDIWHLHAPNITTMLAILACPAVRPLVVTHHSDIVRQKILKHAVRPIEHAVYGRAARVLTTSPPYLHGSDVLKRYIEKVDNLPLGIDLHRFRNPSKDALAHAEQYRSKYKGPLWLCVGRMVYYKALQVALQALKSVPGTLLVIGTGPMLSNWQQLAEELGVSERVIWLGAATDDELVGAYHAATAYWFPSNSRAEGFGLVQVEAMACGCPIINTAIPHSGVAWVGVDQISALTVPINDSEALALSSRRLLEEPGLRDRLSQAGIREAETRFEQQIMGKKSLAIYQSVLDS